MSVVTVQRGFALPTATLVSAAERLLGALQDETIGAPMASHLPPGFTAGFSAQIALVSKLSADQSGAVGSVASLVQAQAEALAEVLRRASIARRAATLAFPGQTTLLRGEFQVGGSGRRDIPRVLEWSRKLLAACQRSAAELESCGWTSASTAALAQAVENLAGCNRRREGAADDKIGLTAGRIVAANRLYRQCRIVQNVAQLVYSGLGGSADPSLVASRARFLLGEFPSFVRPAELSVAEAALPEIPAANASMPFVAAAA